MLSDFHHNFLFKLTYFMDTTLRIIIGFRPRTHIYLIYHHSTVPIVFWLMLNYYPGGHLMVSVLINLLTHSILHGYMFITELIPKLRELNTSVHIQWLVCAELIAIFLHVCQLFFLNTCGYPMTIIYISTLWGFSLMGYFLLIKSTFARKFNLSHVFAV